VVAVMPTIWGLLAYEQRKIRCYRPRVTAGIGERRVASAMNN